MLHGIDQNLMLLSVGHFLACLAYNKKIHGSIGHTGAFKTLQER